MVEITADAKHFIFETRQDLVKNCWITGNHSLEEIKVWWKCDKLEVNTIATGDEIKDATRGPSSAPLFKYRMDYNGYNGRMDGMTSSS
jgi:hypothetical protein